MSDLNNYEVTLRDMRTDYRRTLIWQVDSFQSALFLTKGEYDPGNEEIIKIEKEYDEYAESTSDN